MPIVERAKLSSPTFRWRMRRHGIADLSKITTAELDAYLVLLQRTDNGRAFLKIMRGFELTRTQPRQRSPS
ncbi:MAG TPA: hypothetical protein VF086_01450 [Propionibacteriaceae bacterium]